MAKERPGWQVNEGDLVYAHTHLGVAGATCADLPRYRLVKWIFLFDSAKYCRERDIHGAVMTFGGPVAHPRR